MTATREKAPGCNPTLTTSAPNKENEMSNNSLVQAPVTVEASSNWAACPDWCDYRNDRMHTPDTLIATEELIISHEHRTASGDLNVMEVEDAKLTKHGVEHRSYLLVSFKNEDSFEATREELANIGSAIATYLTAAN